MKWQLILLHGLFVYFLIIIIEAKCVGHRAATTRHIWRQLKQPLPTETSTCQRPQTRPGSDNATDATVVNATATTQQLPPVVTLANYVYQCGKRQENDCNAAKELEFSDEDKQQMAIIKTIDLDMI